MIIYTRFNNSTILSYVAVTQNFRVFQLLYDHVVTANTLFDPTELLVEVINHNDHVYDSRSKKIVQYEHTENPHCSARRQVPIYDYVLAQKPNICLSSKIMDKLYYNTIKCDELSLFIKIEKISTDRKLRIYYDSLFRKCVINKS